MECPACSNQLARANYRGVDLDCCPDCAGAWFDNFELKKITDTDQSLFDFPGSEKSGTSHKSHGDRECPKCLIKLMTHFYGPKKQVEIDRCAGCNGIWLDALELQKIKESYPTEAARLEELNKLVLSFSEKLG